MPGLQSQQVLLCGVRHQLQGQSAGIGRDDELLGGRAPQRQSRYAVRRVLIGQRVVAAGMR